MRVYLICLTAEPSKQRGRIFSIHVACSQMTVYSVGNYKSATLDCPEASAAKSAKNQPFQPSANISRSALRKEFLVYNPNSPHAMCFALLDHVFPNDRVHVQMLMAIHVRKRKAGGSKPIK